MKTDQVKVIFQDNFKGEMQSPTGKISLGKEENGMMPYHLLYGALASCFYATFLSVAQKMRLDFEQATITVDGEKRDEVPQTLSHVQMNLVIKNPSNEEKLRKAAELGAKYCSIHETILSVSTIDLDISFI